MLFCICYIIILFVFTHPINTFSFEYIPRSLYVRNNSLLPCESRPTKRRKLSFSVYMKSNVYNSCPLPALGMLLVFSFSVVQTIQWYNSSSDNPTIFVFLWDIQCSFWIYFVDLLSTSGCMHYFTISAIFLMILSSSVTLSFKTTTRPCYH
jgi:hypothetical protein